MSVKKDTQEITLEIRCPVCGCNALEWGNVSAFFTPDTADPFWHQTAQHPDGVRSCKCTRCNYLMLFDLPEAQQ
ncbi:MAG: hypothetical protein AAF653_04160 [Chloroflexota bacterium]